MFNQSRICSMCILSEPSCSPQKRAQDACKEFRQVYHKGPVLSQVPTAVAIFPKELYRAPRAWASAKYNIKQWNSFKSGGESL
jgi:hypothetical protein